MNPKQQAFVCEMLRHGNRAEAYKAAYHSTSNNQHSLQSAANRLMKNPEVSGAIRSVHERIYAEVQEELKARITREVLTVQRKRELLAQIAEGEWMLQPPPADMSEQRTAVLIPTLKERLKALDMDNRMTGAYEKEETTKHNNTQQEPPDTANNDEAVTLVPATESVQQTPQPLPHIRMPFIIPVVDTHDPQLNRPVTSTTVLLQQPPWLQPVRV
ncbi:terminase small subunit [Polluticoccus soli]|uniref:terminase small subunit n=1 Tax=Polluticoccus soli TaxID=3034150 RepID=UPI0023E24A91|nr:terminase small subunit [Flavipsychrobacter sp. JY13-12]